VAVARGRALREIQRAQRFALEPVHNPELAHLGAGGELVVVARRRELSAGSMVAVAREADGIEQGRQGVVRLAVFDQRAGERSLRVRSAHVCR
jgi:hypothetical protein